MSSRTYYIFDWEKAARLINKWREQDSPLTVYAGLIEDWSNTSGCIWKDGHIVTDSYVYLLSRFATPGIKKIQHGQSVTMSCFKSIEAESINAYEKLVNIPWPIEAQTILLEGIYTNE